MSDGELVLFGASTGNCRRAAIGLIEAGVPFRAQRVDLARGEHLQTGPDGKVPVLVGRPRPDMPEIVLTQSNAILFFADEKRPGCLLPPRGDPSRTRILEAYFYFVTDVIAVNNAAFALRRQGHAPAADLLDRKVAAAITRSERFVDETGRIGGCFSMADIAGFTVANAVSADIAWDRVPKLRSWFDSIGSRPAVQRGSSIFD